MFKLKRRYKLLIIISISIISIFLIYHFIYYKKEYIVSIGDYLSTGKIFYSSNKNYNEYLKEYYKDKLIIKEFCNENLSSYDALYLLKNNDSKIKHYIKNANIIILNIGNYELNNYKELSDEIIIDYLNNIYSILENIRKINDKKIVLFNIFNESKKYDLINKKLLSYSKEFNTKYIDLNKLDIDFYYNINEKFYFNGKAYDKISKMIIKND